MNLDNIKQFITTGICYIVIGGLTGILVISIIAVIYNLFLDLF